MFDDRERRAVSQVLESGKWGHTHSPDARTVAFEQESAAYHSVRYAVSLTSGSTALEVPLRTVGIGHGDEVITPPTTWVATNLAPVMVRADPVFVDVDPETYCLDPDKIEAAITPRMKAIVAIHLGGYLCDMDRIVEIAARHHLVVI